MGRRAGKLKVELIENQKARILAFKRRKECLLKKTKELSTLCDVNACLLLHAPEHESPSVWPPNDPTLVGRLIHHNRAKNSKNADEIAQFGFLLEIKAKLIEAQLQIDRLKSERDRQRELMDDVDDNGKAQQFAVDVRKKAQVQIETKTRDDAEQQDLDNSSPLTRGEAGYDIDDQDQLVRARIDDQYHHQQQDLLGPVDNLDQYPQKQQQYQLMDNADQQQWHTIDLMPPLDISDYDIDEWAQELDLFGSSSSSVMPSGPDQTMMMMDSDQSFCNGMAGFHDQHEEEGESCSTQTAGCEAAGPDQTMMMMDSDQSFCNGMAGFHDQHEEEGASCSTQTAGCEAVQEWYEEDLIAQLHTPPRLTWQSTNFDHNLWV